MILIDANILLYAHSSSSRHHAAARRWLEEVLSTPEPVGLAWDAILAFIRISTSAQVYSHPLTTEEAVGIVTDWLDRPMVRIAEPDVRHWDVLRGLLEAGQVRAALVMDAHLAALAIEHGATLCSTDRDFTRFPGLRWTNPLAA